MNIRKIPQSNSPAVGATKIASAQPSSKLERALAAALSEEKVASETPEVVATPSAQRTVHSDLSKLAEEVAVSSFDRQVAQVDKLGTVMADAFVRRIGDWEEGSAKLASARASEAQLTHEELAMINDYRTNPALFVQKVAAMVEGAEPEMTEKQAADIYNTTAQETVRHIHKLAADHFAEGYRAAGEILVG